MPSRTLGMNWKWKKNITVERELYNMNKEKEDKEIHLKVVMDTEGADEGIL